jgi:DNA-binding PadR family transcriptional regulator
VLELAVLGLLKEQPLHGYELKKRLGETLGFLWGVSYGSLYPALRRLEREGAIESVDPAPALSAAPPVPTGSLTGDRAAARRRVATRRSEGSRRTRKAYRITERGEQTLVDLLLADDDRADDEKGFAVKLAFCRHAPADARLRFLERRRDALRSRVERAGGTGARHSRERARSQDRYLTSLLEHRARATARDLEWVEELIASERSASEFLGQEGATA